MFTEPDKEGEEGRWVCAQCGSPVTRLSELKPKEVKSAVKEQPEEGSEVGQRSVELEEFFTFVNNSRR